MTTIGNGTNYGFALITTQAFICDRSFSGPLISTEEEKRASSYLDDRRPGLAKAAGTENSRDRRAADSGSRESRLLKFNFVGRLLDG